ncbi:FAD/NAD(P)-binding domain-containing protein [Dentipellis sp. KUC8613]|nr:FAD/NAD(P)-binding domain-containing protein [Dentipellis sp. KUC8613]
MLPILIVGAGVVGLTLAQGLKKRGIPFLIFERDKDAEARVQGWGLTLHWCLDSLYETLPEELHEKILDVQVDPEQGRVDKGNFLYLNTLTGETVWKIPPSRRLRLKRESFRRLLMQGIDIQFGKTFASFEILPDGVAAHFADGSSVKGSLLIGADGSNSNVRKQLCPETHQLQQLPIRFTGVSYEVSEEAVSPLRKIDPLLFQGTNPETNDYLWFSILDVPATNGGDHYTIQVNVSWPVKSPADEVKSSSEERLANMKRRGAALAEPMRSVILDIPEGTHVTEVKLADWPCLEWEGRGRVTLIGDAAHAMTMYRGEAANHGIMDAHRIYMMLQRCWNDPSRLEEELEEQEAEMRKRTAPAVLLSRQACIDAHDWSRLKEGSPVLAKRVIQS